jgi:hypothetical protein
MNEELGAEIALLAPPFVVENLFVCDGIPGHEINFLFPARFTDIHFYERKSYSLLEANGDTFKALWIPIGDCVSGKLRLVPEELATWYHNKFKGKHE